MFLFSEEKALELVYGSTFLFIHVLLYMLTNIFINKMWNKFKRSFFKWIVPPGSGVTAGGEDNPFPPKFWKPSRYFFICAETVGNPRHTSCLTTTTRPRRSGILTLLPPGNQYDRLSKGRTETLMPEERKNKRKIQGNFDQISIIDLCIGILVKNTLKVEQPYVRN